MKIGPGAILLLADGARMLLLRNSGDAACPVLDVIAHRTIDNPPNRQQLSDAPGLSFSSHGPWRNTEQKSDPHQEREDVFAIGSAAALATAVSEYGSEVIVVAPPRKLDELSRTGRRQTLRAGQTLMWEGDEAMLVGNVVDGVLKLSLSSPDGRDQTLGIAYPSDFIGHPFGLKSHHSVIAVSPEARPRTTSPRRSLAACG